MEGSYKTGMDEIGPGYEPAGTVRTAGRAPAGAAPAEAPTRPGQASSPDAGSVAFCRG
ncbi:hypothetical protein GCM10014713_59800 [Streptomyces purpureus]|uniref:Uncharacterized protein n=1 Tax=Streptomyces purpureus TaxID=1951 RepID=A0A918HF00_9ACTN|nr:hypothetical protein GCM10014713_59800 [Streptomyces purpureus]